MLFERKRDAQRFLEVLPKRFGKYGLTLHPEKTRLVPFRRPDRVDHDDDHPGTFDLLGFTHHWGTSRRGSWIIKVRTAKNRFSRALHQLRTWCGWHRHDDVETQHRMLSKKLRGHYAYYGMTSNFDALARPKHEVERVWRKPLARRSQYRMTWRTMKVLLQRFPLPTPRMVHRYTT